MVIINSVMMPMMMVLVDTIMMTVGLLICLGIILRTDIIKTCGEQCN